MKDINELMQETLNVDQLKLKDEIEDLESDFSLFNIMLTISEVYFPSINSQFPASITYIERKRDKLKEQLKAKWDEYKRIRDRLAYYGDDEDGWRR